MTSYKQIQLYGGAITVSVPTDFDDVSSIREVPDHQEVYLENFGLGSVIFDIVERAEPPDHPACTTDIEALKYHFEDIVDSRYANSSAEMKEETKIWATADAVFEQLPGKPACTMFATQHPLAPPVGAPDFTAILLTLLRLPEHKTDVLISINVPHVRGERGYFPELVELSSARNGRLIDKAMEFRSRVLQSFKIIDWNLFGGDEDH